MNSYTQIPSTIINHEKKSLRRACMMYYIMCCKHDDRHERVVFFFFIKFYYWKNNDNIDNKYRTVTLWYNNLIFTRCSQPFSSVLDKYLLFSSTHYAAGERRSAGRELRGNLRLCRNSHDGRKRLRDRIAAIGQRHQFETAALQSISAASMISSWST